MVGLAVASLLAGATLSASAQDEPGSSIPQAEVVYQGTTASQDRQTIQRHLGCTGIDEPPNFAPASAGPSFRGLPVTTVIRRCDAPYPGEPIRANSITYIYGTCEIGSADACAPPLVIQTWPACERTLTDYSFDGHAYPHSDLGRVKGVPARSFDDGSRVELYTGASTVVVMGLNPADVQDAASDIRMEPTDASPAAPLTDLQRAAPDWRHFCATQLLELGLDHFAVSIQLGHTDGGALVMSRYGHPSEDAARRRLLGAFELDPERTGSSTGSSAAI